MKVDLETGIRFTTNDKQFPPLEADGVRKDLVELTCPDIESFDVETEYHHMSIWDV